MSTLELLFENEIPAGRQALQDSHHNLQDVANYCEDNYRKASDKRRALEETKNFTTQSLASVAYQINTLATSMLQMLDLQATQLANMESSINHIAQNVAIHKEKVARREIGVLTTNKNCPRTHKVVTPPNPEKQLKYKSTPIDFSALDDVGHGLKLSSPSTTSGRPRTDSQASTSTSNSGGGGAYEALPVYQPRLDDPYNSMRRRMPNHPPVAPTVPPQYMSIGKVGMRDSHHGAPPKERPSIPGYMQGQPDPNVPAAPPPPPNMPGTHPGMAPVGQVPPPPPVMSGPPHTNMGQPPPPNMGPPAPPAPPIGGMMPPAPSPAPAVHQLPPATHQPPPAAQQPPPQQQPNFAAQLNQAIGMRPGAGEAQRNSINPYGDIGMPPPPDMGASDLPPPPMDSMVYSQDSVVMPPPPEFEQVDDDQFVPTQYIEKDEQGDPVPFIEKVVAVFEYVADREDELSFEEGAIVYVLKKNEDGWYEGICQGLTGLFPGNYVELCP
nr:abl interactor 2-like isoform X1 [Lytechinus pictus]